MSKQKSRIGNGVKVKSLLVTEINLKCFATLRQVLFQANANFGFSRVLHDIIDIGNSNEEEIILKRGLESEHNAKME